MMISPIFLKKGTHDFLKVKFIKYLAHRHHIQGIYITFTQKESQENNNT